MKPSGTRAPRFAAVGSFLTLLIACESLGIVEETESQLVLAGCLGANGAVTATQMPAVVTTVAPLLADIGDGTLGYLLDQQITGAFHDLTQQFGLHPTGRYYDDGVSPNAFATPTNTEGSRDGTVRLGVRLIASEVRRFLANDYSPGHEYTYSVTAVLAHEMGHILQFKRQQAPPHRDTELQADFLAGWYFSTLASRDPNYGPNAVRDGMRTFYAMGDYNFTSPQHHGTPEQRLAAFMAGLENSASDVNAAWTAAVAYRQQLGGEIAHQ